jgi:hypothetical protein
MRLIQYNFVFIFKLQTEFFPFKIVPFGGYLSPEMFPLFVAALEVANRNRFKLVGYSCFVPKWRPFRENVSFGNEKRRTDSGQEFMGALEPQECPF